MATNFPSHIQSTWIQFYDKPQKRGAGTSASTAGGTATNTTAKHPSFFVIVYIDDSHHINYLISDPHEEGVPKFKKGVRIAVGDTLVRAQKIALVHYHDSDPTSQVSNQIRIYYISQAQAKTVTDSDDGDGTPGTTVSESDMKDRVREVCLRVPDVGVLADPKWFFGGTDKTVREKFAPGSPLSAVVHKGTIKLFYRKFGTDVLWMASNAPKGKWTHDPVVPATEWAPGRPS